LRGRKPRRTRRALWTSLTLLVFTMAACAANAPQDTLKPDGPVARQEDHLFKPVFWIAAAVFVLVEFMVVYFAWRFRQRSDADAPKQIHGNKRLEILWTILPAALLAGIAIPTVLTIFDVAQRPVGSNVLNVKVTGHQWWWEYEYTDFKTEGGNPVRTANELVIPSGRWVYLSMTSVDVIHSYWVPKLAGKQDVIPGRITHLKLKADHPGVYRGQCAEFCAVSHANMRLRAIALSDTDFDAWVRNQQRPAVPPTDQEVFSILTNGLMCAKCHTIDGIRSPDGEELVQGTFAPNLTHLASRTTFAGSTFPLTAENLFRWIDNPTAMKPLTGSIKENRNEATMPDYNLTKEQIDAIVAYLMSLR
jgi:cytochrome c oxidase subunit II